MLYKTGVEYGDYTMNHVQGCSHGCLYPCYAFLLKKRFGQIKSYEQWIEPVLVSNTLELLDKEIPRLERQDPIGTSLLYNRSVHAWVSRNSRYEHSCYQKAERRRYQMYCTTKGILPIELAELSKENEYGITFISLNEEYRAKIEPGAAPYADRLAALRALHDAGCKTWVSMEPYPTPNLIDQNLHDLLEAVSFVDKIIFGRTNYSTEVSAYKEHKAYYNELAKEVISFCEERGIQYHIKEKTIT